MLQCLLRSGALCYVEREKLRDKVFGLGRDRVPDFVCKAEFSLANRSHDLCVCHTVERRNSREQNKDNYTSAPDVALFSVTLLKNLGCNVVGRANLFAQLLAGIENESRTEVDDFDLVKLLRGL